MAAAPPTFSIKGGLDVLEDAQLHAGLEAQSLNIIGNSIINGTLHVIGDCTLAGTLFSNSSDPLHLDHIKATYLDVAQQITTVDLASTGNCALYTLTVDSDTFLAALTATGDTLLKGSTTCEQSLTCLQPALLQAGATTTTLTTTDVASLASCAIVGDVRVNGTTLLNNVQIAGATAFADTVTFASGEAVTINGPATFTAAATHTSTLNLTAGLTVSAGNTALQSLQAAGVSILSGNVNLTNGASFTVGTGNAAFGGNVSVAGTSSLAAVTTTALDVSGASSLDGALTVSASSNFSGKLTAAADIAVAGNAAFSTSSWTGATAFGGNSTWTGGSGISVTSGSVDFGGTLHIAGVTTFSGDAVAGSNLQVGGALSVSGASALSSLTVASSLTTAAQSTVQFGGPVSLNGATTTVSGALFANTAALSGSLTVTGAQTNSSTLTVGGAISGTSAALSGGLTVEGALTAQSTAQLLGNVTLGGPTSSVTFGNGFSTAGPVNFTGAVTADTADVTTLTATHIVLGGSLSTGTTLTAVNGPLEVTGTSVFKNDITANTNLSVVGSVTTPQLTAVNSVLTNATVSGALTANSVSVTNSFTVGGAFNAASLVTPGPISGAACSVSSINCAGAASLSGAVQAESTITVAGTSSLQQTSTTALTVNGALAVSTGSSTTLGGTLSVAGAAALQDNVVVTKNLTVSGDTAVQKLTVAKPSTFADTVTVSAPLTTNSITTTGALVVAGTSTLQSVSTTGVTVAGDVHYNGSLYQGLYPIRFGHYGADFNAPAIFILPATAVVASQIELTLDPVQQIPLGVLGAVVPQINSLTISVQPAAGGAAQVILANDSPESITQLSLYCYADDDTTSASTGLTGRLASDSTTHFEVYGLAPATQYTVGLYYSNDLGSASAFYVSNLQLPTAGAPAAPAIVSAVNAAVTGDFEQVVFTLSASITDSSHPTATPQPALSKFTVSYQETSSIGDHATPASGSTSTTTTTTSAQQLQCATVYTATAQCYNKVLPSTASPVSAATIFYTGYNASRFNTGVTLTDGAMLSAPSNSYRFASAQYVSRANTALSASDILTKPSWSISLHNLRLNYEPHPAHTGIVVKWSAALTGDSGGDSVLVSSLWNDAALKQATSSTCTLSVSTPTDCNVGGEAGFFKQVPTLTVALTNTYASYAQHSLQISQELQHVGDWAYAAGAVSYTELADGVDSHKYTNTLSFYVDDASAVPSITSVTELAGSRVASSAPAVVSGLPTLPLSSTALTTQLAVGMQNAGSFWFPVGSVVTISASDTSLTGQVVNSTSACAPLYSDSSATSQPIAASTPIAQSSTVYRPVAVVLNTSVWTDGVYEEAAGLYVALNIVGSSAVYTSKVRNFRCDVGSLSHPHYVSIDGKSTLYGQRVLLNSNTTAFPDTSGAVDKYDHTQLLVNNSTDARYNGEAGMYNGLYYGASGLWQSDWSARSYDLGSSISFPDYSQSGSSTRYSTFRYPGVSTAAGLFQHITVTLDSAACTAEAHDIYYKYVDTVDGSHTTPWKNLLLPATGAITSGADGSGGRYASSVSKTVTSTTVPVNDAGTIYIRIAVPVGSGFAFRGVRITDFDTSTALTIEF